MKTILSRPDASLPTSARLKAMNAYFFMLWPQGKLMEVRPLIEEALELGIKLEDRWNMAFTFVWAGMMAAGEGDYARVTSYLQQSHEKWQESGDETYKAMSLVFLGDIYMFQHEYNHAEALYEEANPRFREVRDYPVLALILRRLGQLALKKGELNRATALIRESLIHNWNVHDYRGTGACLAALAAVSMAQKKPGRATKLFGAVDAVLQSAQIPLLPFDQQEYERNMSQLRGQLDGSVFEKAWSNGRVTPLEQTIEFALKETKV